MQYEEHRQAAHDRLQLLRREAHAERLARQARLSQYRRQRRRALAEALLLRRRRGAQA